ncbi:hypothetical protein [Streptomyces sp. SID3343]|uniref:SCO2583 family membrane protein n=1 Tax=Streptomyces sp. SID3343 TaxID=2690260 RepID=UPI00136817BB|nr:hypothetical protein [Streptomyces sp. SID3343]MYV99617.1 hypothetical protein [Streptomyces sp. SID3343]
MSGRDVPPEGPNRGGPDGEDEFGAVVFDAAFVRAADLHEPSARERLHGGQEPHRLRRVLGIPLRSLRGALAATIVLAVLAAAGYLGAHGASAPRPNTDSGAAVLQRVSLAPPVGWAPGPLPADPMAGSPAATWAQGAAGISTAEHRATAHFTADQVGQALDLVREFLVDTQLDPAVLRGARPWSALPLLRRGQRDQLGAALADPRDDDRSAPTGWVTRFDPEAVRVLDVPARVAGTLAASELARDDLVVAADVVFVYAVGQPGGPGWTRFTVHRVWDFHVDADALHAGLLQVRRALTTAAPQRCASDTAAWFRPVFAADPQTDAPLPDERVDPYGSAAAAGTCGRLASPP